MIRAQKKLIATGVYCGTCGNYERGAKTIPTLEIIQGSLHETYQCICANCGTVWQHTDVHRLEYHYTISDQIQEEEEEEEEDDDES